MKKSFFIVLICVALLLTCCNSSTQSDINSEDSEQATEYVKVNDYPELIDTEKGKRLIPLLPDEVFSVFTDKTEYIGTLYCSLCWVREYIYDENGAIDAYRVETSTGDIIVADFYERMVDTASNYDSLSTLDTELFRSLIPILPKDELICLFAEYQGMSNEFGYEDNLPFLIYGGEDYIVDALAYSSYIPEETTPETQETSPSSADPTPTEETKPVTQYGAGMYKVGTDLPAGEYLFFANDRYSAYVCASTDSNQDDIIENENFDYTFFMTVADGQYLQAKRCVFVEASSATVEINADGSLPEGMYRVGIDIPAGEYRLTADDGDSGYWCTYNSTIIPLDVEDNDIFDGSTYVTVTDGQYLIINRCTAKLAE